MNDSVDLICVGSTEISFETPVAFEQLIQAVDSRNSFVRYTFVLCLNTMRTCFYFTVVFIRRHFKILV